MIPAKPLRAFPRRPPRTHVSEEEMKTFAPVAFAAISGVVLWKLLATLLLPVLGILIGLFATVMKFALIAGVIYFIYSMVRKRRDEAQA
jgi:hypothetical protein